MPSNEGIGLSKGLQPFKVLVVGACYGGLAATLNLLDLCAGRSARFGQPTDATVSEVVPVEITVVDERDGYFHIISSPLALASKSFSPKVWTKFRDIPALQNTGVHFVQGTVTEVDCHQRRAIVAETGSKITSQIPYDFLVAATGLRRAWPVVPQSVFREDYLAESEAHIDQIQNAGDGVVVIGGGAVGIEMAAEIKLVMPRQRVTLIHSRDKLCSAEPLPDEFKDRCLLALLDMGVETILGQRVQSETQDGDNWVLHLANGASIRAGKTIYALSQPSPSTQYLPMTALDGQGYVNVTSSLNLPPNVSNSQYHFAVGDIAKWSGIKRCGTALYMGHYAAQNIYQLMLKQHQGTEPQLMQLVEIPPMIGIAIGRQGVAYHPSDGTTFGEKVLQTLFGDDLGNTICWNYMQLDRD